jgi:DNA polymerase-3 subunit delta
MARAAAGEPWGRPALAAAIAKLAKGWPEGLTVLTGDDLYHLDRAQAAILDHLVPDRTTAYGLSIVGDAPIPIPQLVGLARSGGMFATRRVVLVRDVSVLEGEPDALGAYAEKPPADSYIVVRAPKLDRKRKLHKALAESGTCLTFRTPANATEGAALIAEMGAMAVERGIALDEDAARLLVDVCGYDLNRITGELDKLSIWAGARGTERRRIDAATVREMVAGSELLSGWELADALTERRSEAAMEAARRLLDAGEEPIRVVGGLAARARSLLKAKAMTEAGAPERAVVDAARAWYFRDALGKGLKRYTLAELLEMPSQLLAVDRSFKSRSLDKGAVLESLVARLTGAKGASR